MLSFACRVQGVEINRKPAAKASVSLRLHRQAGLADEPAAAPAAELRRWPPADF
jgi:hypothetical protein